MEFSIRLQFFLCKFHRCIYRSNNDVVERRAMTSRSLDATSPPLTAATSRSSVSSCGHNNAGQELCYLCHQRARRNVYLDLAEEKRRKEEEETRLLREFQQYRDAVEMQKEQVRTFILADLVAQVWKQLHTYCFVYSCCYGCNLQITFSCIVGYLTENDLLSLYVEVHVRKSCVYNHDNVLVRHHRFRDSHWSQEVHEPFMKVPILQS